ncbi:MAG: hypothetical protein GY737_32925 [Desulfobacteraceae bacterium]|nr:hypothetical protein [Desulfobacteraceae bacterium]
MEPGKGALKDSILHKNDAPGHTVNWRKSGPGQGDGTVPWPGMYALSAGEQAGGRLFPCG